MDIDICKSAQDLERMRTEWDSLLDRSENRDVLHSHLWYASWGEAFTRPGDMLVLSAREGGRLKAVLPLMKRRYRRGRLAINGLASMTNRCSALFDLLSDDPSPGLLGALFRKAFKSTHRGIITLEKISGDSLIMRHIEAAAEAGRFLYLARPVTESWTVHIDSAFEPFFNGRESKFKKNMRAAERKSAINGPLKLLQPAGPEELDAYLDRGFVLQSNGWKGREGTAIMQNEQAQKFYKSLAVKGFEAGWLRYMLLASNGDDMSFMYCLGAFGTIHALEIGMDERFRNLGAGMVVTKKMLEQVFAEKRFDAWDFGEGRDRWKRDWSDGRNLKYNLLVFPKNPLGIFLHACARYYDNRHPYHPFGEEETGEGAKNPKEETQ